MSYLNWQFNFDRFGQSIRDLLRLHTTKVGPFISMFYASNNEGNKVPKFFSVLFFVFAHFNTYFYIFRMNDIWNCLKVFLYHFKTKPLGLEMNNS